MRTCLFLLGFWMISVMSNAQTVDSLEEKVSATNERLDRLDSAAQQIVQPPDSLLPSFQRAKTIRLEFNLAADSIRSNYQSAVAKINATKNEFNDKIDSLTRLDLPATPFKQKLDSLQDVRQKIESKFTSRLNKLKSGTSKKLNSLDLPPEYQQPIDDLTRKINEMGLSTDGMTLPDLGFSGYSIPEMNGAGDLMQGLGKTGDVNALGKLPDIDTPAGEIKDVSQQVQSYQDDIKSAVPDGLKQGTQQAQTYQEDIRNITEGKAGDVEKIPKSIEQQASKVKGIDELQKKSGVVDEQEAKLEDFKDPEMAKKKAVEMGKKAAVDHFAGKQEQLKAAMEKISKYKQKYSSVSSIKDLPKRPPNAMKGKPFIERVVPGLYFQYQQKNLYFLDINPYGGYKLSGRFTVGAGWNHRIAWDSKGKVWNERSIIFGPRVYLDFKLGKGFIAHLEGETMNSFVPSTLIGNPDSGNREWVWSFMTGLKKEYKIYKNLKGTALIQYNWFNRYYKAPYVDRVNSRIGFEYVIKKAKREPVNKK